MYLLKTPKNKKSNEIGSQKTERAQNADELEERLEVIKNKMKSKKTKMSARTIQKREIKKLKRDQEIKKKLIISVNKAMKNEKVNKTKTFYFLFSKF